MLWASVFNQPSLTFEGFPESPEFAEDLEGHKQGAATLRWKEHRKGFGDKIKKEKTGHLLQSERGGRLAITQAGGLLENWRALTLRPAWEGGRDPAREAVCHQQHAPRGNSHLTACVSNKQ